MIFVFFVSQLCFCKWLQSAIVHENNTQNVANIGC